MNSCGIDLKQNTIQAIRMISAISESDYQVHVKEEDYQIFEYLQNFFDIKVKSGLVNHQMLNEVSIDHDAPSCTIGSITKPLIFPKSVFNFCRSKWKTERNFTYYFSGLLTEKRLVVLQDWISSHYKHNSVRKDLDLLLIKLIGRYVQYRTKLDKKGVSCKYEVAIGKGEQLCLAASTIGRHFPEKSWDDNYFNQISNAKFVLCPNGDFIWTYRFLEAIMCGAIPIVESEAEMYCGFHYYKMGDQTSEYVYDRELVNENFDLALNRFSISTEKLNQEIENLLEKHQSQWRIGDN